MSPKPGSLTYAGACRIGLELRTDTANCGETVSGRILLLGGRRSQLIERVEVTLVDLTAEPYNYAVQEWTELTVASRREQHLDFSIQIPERLPVQYPFVIRLAARAQGDQWARTGRSIQILPATCYQQLAQVLAEAAGIPVAAWTTIGGGDGVAARLQPDDTAQKIFDALRLEMFRSGPALYGELEVDPREHTLSDRMKAAVGADRRRYPFRFRSPDSEPVRAFFEQCLRPYVDVVRQLPIPAEANTQRGAVLPRPSRADGEPPGGNS